MTASLRNCWTRWARCAAPLIHGRLEDRGRYQTVYAKEEGSAAAPTAGLHFTDAVLECVRARGVKVVSLLLHVGLGTFRPVKAVNVEDHVMHEEWFELDAPAAEAVNAAREAGGRVVSSAPPACARWSPVRHEDARLSPMRGQTGNLYHPGYRFKAVDALLNNFHCRKHHPDDGQRLHGPRERPGGVPGGRPRKVPLFSFGDCMSLRRHAGRCTA